MKSLSSIRFVAPLCLLAVVSAACKSGEEDDGSGGSAADTSANGTTTNGSTGTDGAGGDTGNGGAGGTGGETSSSSTGAGTPGWTLIPLLDDVTDPESTIYRKDNDLITGIHFASLDEGYVSTYGDEQTFQDGGALFKTSSTEVTGILVSSANELPCLLGGANFQGIEPSPDGYVLLANGCNTVASHDGGETFTAELNSPGGSGFGIERVYGVRFAEDETIMILDHYLSVSDEAPGPSALWDDIWAPEANPPTPDPVPEDQCQGAPAFGATPMRQNVSANADGSHIAYVSNEDEGAAICVSTDSGRSFFPKYVADLGEDAVTFAPDGVAFATDSVGVAWWGNYIYPGQQWIAQTTDGGETWTKVAFPESIADTGLELRGGFFAPDGEHGWIVGYDYDHSVALLVKTSDGGATWSKSGGDLAEKVATTFGGKLHTGFALDANNIWVGGEGGVFAFNSAGGE